MALFCKIYSFPSGSVRLFDQNVSITHRLLLHKAIYSSFHAVPVYITLSYGHEHFAKNYQVSKTAAGMCEILKIVQNSIIKKATAVTAGDLTVVTAMALHLLLCIHTCRQNTASEAAER